MQEQYLGDNPDPENDSFLRRWIRRKSADESSNAAADPPDPETPGDGNAPESGNRGYGDPLDPRILLGILGNSHFNVLDGLNEYDDDFTSFSPLGNLVTHEMKRLLSDSADLGPADAEPCAQAGTRETPDDPGPPASA